MSRTSTEFQSPQAMRVRQAGYLTVSRLLTYPDAQLLDEIPAFAAVAKALPGPVAQPLLEYLAHVSETPLLALQENYVSTFDLKRRCCLYLSYYLNGDTRRRGMALWRFQETYRQAGWESSTGELVDFLPMVLEFAALGPDEEQAALSLIHQHHEGLEVLRAALKRSTSPTELVVTSLLELLPELTPEQREAAQRLVAEGPPTEMVGLEPFGPQLLTIGARP